MATPWHQEQNDANSIFASLIELIQSKMNSRTACQLQLMKKYFTTTTLLNAIVIISCAITWSYLTLYL